jgi:UDP-N-acetylglucosamine 4-epimerase
VFGPRQDPNGQYAAVIPRWIAAIKKGDRVRINGDGKTSRDFCYVDNVVQANLLAGLGKKREETCQIYNVACGNKTSLTSLNREICIAIKKINPQVKIKNLFYQQFRRGDVRHSLASIENARVLLGYEPTHTIKAGLEEAMDWYVKYCEQGATSFSNLR